MHRPNLDSHQHHQNRYVKERAQLEVALQMIAFEARTCTIRTCTGLSDDRIRTIYARYFTATGRDAVHRKRGKSPSQTAIYVKKPGHQCEATVLAAFFAVHGLLRCQARGTAKPCMDRRCLDFGQRICVVYSAYLAVFPSPLFSFERAWALYHALAGGVELTLTPCPECNGRFVHDALSGTAPLCPSCRLKGLRKGGGKHKKALW